MYVGCRVDLAGAGNEVVNRLFYKNNTQKNDVRNVYRSDVIEAIFSFRLATFCI